MSGFICKMDRQGLCVGKVRILFYSLLFLFGIVDRLGWEVGYETRWLTSMYVDSAQSRGREFIYHT